MPLQLPRSHRLPAALWAALLLLSSSVYADPIVEPGQALDESPATFAEGDQGPTLLAPAQGGWLAVYADAADGVHATWTDGTAAGASRNGLRLEPAVSLVDADLAAEGTDALVVWIDDGDVFGQRLFVVDGDVSANGPIILIESGTFASPRVAFGPSEWLVVYRDGAGALLSSFVGFASGIFNNGELFAGPVASLDADGNDSHYGIAYMEAGTSGHVHLLDVDVTGGVTANRQLTSATTSSTALVQLAVDDSAGWATWFVPAGRVFGRPLTADLVVNSPGVLAISPLGSAVVEAAVAANGANSAWSVYRQGGTLVTQRWNANGTAGSTHLLSINATSAAAADGVPALVGWVDDSAGAGDIFTSQLALPGPTAAIRLTLGTGARQSLDVAFVEPHYVAAWSAPTAARDHDIWLSRADELGDPTGTPVLVASGVANQTDVVLAYGDGTLLVVWVEDGTTLAGRRYALGDPSSAEADATDICTTVDGLSDPDVVDFVGTSGDFLLVWVDLRQNGSDPDLAAVQLPSSGSLAAGCGTLIVNTPAAESQPSLAARGDAATLAWLDGVAPADLLASILDADGVPGIAATLAADVSSLAAAPWDVDVWAVAYGHDNEGDGEVVLAILDASADLANSVAVPRGPDDSDTNPVLATTGTTAALAFQRDPEGVMYAHYAAGAWTTGTPLLAVPVADYFGGPLTVVMGPDADSAGLLVASALSGGNSEERVVLRRALGDPQPVADAGGPYAGSEGVAVLLDATTSRPVIGSPIVTYEWLVNGDNYTGATVNVTLPDNGTYPVVLTVTDDADRSDTANTEVVVANTNPSVAITGEPLTFSEGALASVTVTASDPGAADDVQLEWDFGDGGTFSGPLATSVTRTHTWAQGTYTLCVTASDKDDGETTDCATVTVNNAAPDVALSGITPISEGATLNVTLTISDPGNDLLDIAVAYGDSSSSLLSDDAPPYPTSASHLYADDQPNTGPASPYNLCVTVTDENDASDVACADVTVTNVAPVLTGDPPTTALEGIDGLGEPLVYQAVLSVSDAGTDTIVADVNADGLAVSTARADDTLELTFTPTLDDWRRRTPAEYDLVVTIDDGDGGSDSLAWTVEIEVQDENADGLPDTCARLFGIDAPGDADSDGDGLSNADECHGGTNPSVDDRPAAPVLNAPADGATVSILNPTLSVHTIVHDEELDYRYAFELYDAPALLPEDLVDSATVSEGLGVLTIWQPETLVDQQTYYWRVRAFQGDLGGAWMDVATFHIGLPNEPPTEPGGIAPIGEQDNTTPLFSWKPSVDADGDELSYHLAIYRDAMLTDMEREVADIPNVTDPVLHDLDFLFPLEDNQGYYWHVWAVDARGLESTPSEALFFEVNASNDRPGTPTIVAPEAGSVVETDRPELIVTAVEDIDDDEITYSFVLSETATFDEIFESEREVVPDEEDGDVHHQVVDPLEEDRTYYWRAAARDHVGLGGFVQGDFRVNLENDAPPTPTWQRPAAGEIVSTANPELAVRNVADPEGDALTYDFEVSSDRQFEEEPLFTTYGVEPGPDEETSVLVTEDLASPATYYARSRAVDELGLASEWTAPQTFIVRIGDELLSPPTPLSPTQGATLPPGTVELEVENSPSGLEFAIEMAIYNDEQLEDNIYYVTDLVAEEDGTTSHITTHSLAEGGYYWQVRISDGTDFSPWSETFSFQIVADGDDVDSGDSDSIDAGGDSGDADGGGPPAPETVEGCECGSAPPTGTGVAWHVLLVAAVLVTLRRRSRRRWAAPLPIR